MGGAAVVLIRLSRINTREECYVFVKGTCELQLLLDGSEQPLDVDASVVALDGDPQAWDVAPVRRGNLDPVLVPKPVFERGVVTVRGQRQDRHLREPARVVGHQWADTRECR